MDFSGCPMYSMSMAIQECGYGLATFLMTSPFCFISDAPHDSPLMAVLWQYWHNELPLHPAMIALFCKKVTMTIVEV
jgi:hypothetical protein